MSGSIKKRMRCAVYIRKSCEEGLDQDFTIPSMRSWMPVMPILPASMWKAGLRWQTIMTIRPVPGGIWNALPCAG